MKGYDVYMRIKQLKEQGFKPTTVAKKLGIHRNTVVWSSNGAPAVSYVSITRL